MTATATLVRIDRTAGRDRPAFDRGPAWMLSDRRNCAPTERHPLFFSQSEKDQTRARNFCGTCPFKVECLTYAVDNDEKHGIWGGVIMSSRPERADAKRRARAVAA